MFKNEHLIRSWPIKYLVFVFLISPRRHFRIEVTPMIDLSKFIHWKKVKQARTENTSDSQALLSTCALALLVPPRLLALSGLALSGSNSTDLRKIGFYSFKKRLIDCLDDSTNKNQINHKRQMAIKSAEIFKQAEIFMLDLHFKEPKFELWNWPRIGWRTEKESGLLVEPLC